MTEGRSTMSIQPKIWLPWLGLCLFGNNRYVHVLILLFSSSYNGVQASIDQQSAPYMQALLERYPIGNSPLFPEKRIYSNNDHYWELNDLRLRLWAVSIVRN